MKWKLKYRLRGTTLIEVLVAMSLISIIFVIGSHTVLQVNGVRAPYREQEYRLEARSILQKLEAGQKSPGVIHFESVTFLLERLPVHPQHGLFQVRIQCFDAQETLLFSRNKIIHAQ